MHRFHPIWRTWGPWLLLALLAASLIPILLLGRYDWPSADDYSYALRTHEAVVQGQCPLTASLKHIAEYYKGWQGTFSAILLMTFTPLTVSPFLYWLTPVVMLASLCLGTFKLSDTLARRALGGTWRKTVFLAVPILLLSIQFVASPKDTFYWWNGAVYYTFTYGISLLLMERMVALKLAATRRQVLWAVIPSTLAALMVGGSNYVSALLSTLLCGLFLLWFLWKDRKKFLLALLPTAVLCAGFLISVVAPGNGVRQASVAPPISPVDAVMESILKAWEDCLDWMNWPILLVFLLMIPLLWSLTERISFRFPLPLVFSTFSFLLFAAQNAPHFYALGVSGPERLRSIVFYSFFWLAVVNLWYWLGWLRRVVLPKISECEKLLRRAWLAVPVILVLLAATTVGFHYCDGSTAAQAAAAQDDGSAEYYWRQQVDRLAVFQDPSISDVRLEPLDVPCNLQSLIYNGDAPPDPQNWVNRALANFYHKHTVATTTP